MVYYVVMDKYHVPTNAPIDVDRPFIEHSELGLRAVDGWPMILVFANGEEYSIQRTVRDADGDLVKVIYGNLIGRLTVFND